MANSRKTTSKKYICKQFGDGMYVCAPVDKDGDERLYRTREAANKDAARLSKTFGVPAVAETAFSQMVHMTGGGITLRPTLNRFAVRWRVRHPWHYNI